MKKFTLFLFVIPLFNAFGQFRCDDIDGPLVINVGEDVVYSVSGGQCGNCYDWDIDSSGNLPVQIISNTDRQSTVTIRANAVGTFVLSNTLFNEDGCKTCAIRVRVEEGCPIEAEIMHELIDNPNPPGDTVDDQVRRFYVEFSSPPDDVDNIEYAWKFQIQTTDIDGEEVIIPFNTNDVSPVFDTECTSGDRIIFAGVGLTPNDCPSSPLSLTFSPGLLCGPAGRVSSSQSISKEIDIYPNPVTDVLNFEGEGLEKNRISIYDSEGIIVFKNIPLVDKNVSVKNLKPGIYFYQITSEVNRNIQNGKIIKQ